MVVWRAWSANLAPNLAVSLDRRLHGIEPQKMLIFLRNFPVLATVYTDISRSDCTISYSHFLK